MKSKVDKIPDLVYCKDCKWLRKKECFKDARAGSSKEIKLFCTRTLWDFQVDEDFFCKAGEKRSENKVSNRQKSRQNIQLQQRP